MAKVVAENDGLDLELLVASSDISSLVPYLTMVRLSTPPEASGIVMQCMHADDP